MSVRPLRTTRDFRPPPPELYAGEFCFRKKNERPSVRFIIDREINRRAADLQRGNTFSAEHHFWQNVFDQSVEKHLRTWKSFV